MRAKNPAVALYRYWHRTLSGFVPRLDDGRLQSNTSMRFGATNGLQGYGLGCVGHDSKGYELLAFGGAWSWQGNVYPLITLNRRGEFWLSMHLHGWKSRDMISRHTFLNWAYAHRTYNWYVDPGNTSGSYTTALDSWTERRHHVDERVLTRPGQWNNELNNHGRIFALVPDEKHQWRIALSPFKDRVHTEPVQRSWNHWEALLEKRWRREERKYRILIGEITPRSSTPRLTEEQIAERHESNARQLAVHLTVDEPAKTQPLRRVVDLSTPVRTTTEEVTDEHTVA